MVQYFSFWLYIEYFVFEALFHDALKISCFIEVTRKPASRVFLAPPEGLTKFLSSLYHAWQLLLAKFFDLVKLEFWPPGPPEPPGGQGSNLNSLFRALRWEGLPLSIWFCYYKRFLRTFTRSGVTDTHKSTRKYLFDELKSMVGGFFYCAILLWKWAFYIDKKYTCNVKGILTSPMENRWPSTVHIETPQYSGLYLANWGM